MRLSLGVEIMAATTHSKKISQSLYTFRFKKKKKTFKFLTLSINFLLKKTFSRSKLSLYAGISTLYQALGLQGDPTSPF